MRTPNTSCVLCGTPLYRRPSEIQRVRFVSCRACHGKAMSEVGMTEAQSKGLAHGRRKGTNNRSGYRHRMETRKKISKANATYHARNPHVAKLKGEGFRGENHYAWRGGVSSLNTSIRQMGENRKWMEQVKVRDCCCVRCGSTNDLEAHHKTHLSVLIEQHAIKSRDDARRFAHVLWDDSNGETLCESCHYQEHGRTRRAAS